MHADRRVNELAEDLHRALSKVFLGLSRRTVSGVAAGELTLAQLSILVTLWERGPMRMTDLAAHERVRTPTTTVAIRRLEKLGLVTRSRDTGDLRAVLVEITPHGHAVRCESLAARYAALATMLNKLSADEQETLEPPVPVDVLGSQSGREIAQLGGEVSTQPLVQLTARQRMSPSTYVADGNTSFGARNSKPPGSR
jgi:DNA-binding MarR family transcriptional regulator